MTDFESESERADSESEIIMTRIRVRDDENYESFKSWCPPRRYDCQWHFMLQAFRVTVAVRAVTQFRVTGVRVRVLQVPAGALLFSAGGSRATDVGAVTVPKRSEFRKAFVMALKSRSLP